MLTILDRTRAWRIALVVGIVGAVLGALGAWIPSYWGDEAASLMSAERSWPSLFRLLSSIDAVHGAYYGFLHLWIAPFGTSEFATRVPSAIAAGLMAAGVVILVSRFGGNRLALAAGVIATMLPRTAAMSVEARSYAMGAAAAVWITILLVDLLARRRSSWAWAGYAVGMAAGMYVFLYLGFLFVIHTVFVLVFHRDRIRRWILWAAVGGVLAAPIAVLGYLEREQIGFLARRNYVTLVNIFGNQWFDPVTLYPCWALVVVAAVAIIRARRSTEPTDVARRRLTVLTLVWILLPTAVLLLGNTFVSPMYNVRYLSFCAPAAAILLALGVRSTARAITRRAPRWNALAASLLVAALVLAFVPNYLVQRGPYAKDGGSDWREAAAYMSTHAQPGDAVIFDQKTKPSQNPRLMVSLYPDDFAGLNDAALVAPFETQPHLWDKVVKNDELTAADLGTDVWAMELNVGKDTPPDVAHLLSLGYEISSQELVHRTTVYHLVRR